MKEQDPKPTLTRTLVKIDAACGDKLTKAYAQTLNGSVVVCKRPSLRMLNAEGGTPGMDSGRAIEYLPDTDVR